MTSINIHTARSTDVTERFTKGQFAIFSINSDTYSFMIVGFNKSGRQMFVQHSANDQIDTVTLRKNGQWRRKGESGAGSMAFTGTYRPSVNPSDYSDPSF